MTHTADLPEGTAIHGRVCKFPPVLALSKSSSPDLSALRSRNLMRSLRFRLLSTSRLSIVGWLPYNPFRPEAARTSHAPIGSNCSVVTFQAQAQHSKACPAEVGPRRYQLMPQWPCSCLHSAAPQPYVRKKPSTTIPAGWNNRA